MTIKSRGGNNNSEGGRGKNIKYKTEWRYRGTYSCRAKRC